MECLPLDKFMDSNSLELIGCCGAYCKTCKVLKEKACSGCKVGYSNGERDLSKAKCKMKTCCIRKKHNSCADCTSYEGCDTIQEFHNKNEYKYKKYKEAITFIIKNGYEKFFNIANKWKMQYGKYNDGKL